MSPSCKVGMLLLTIGQHNIIKGNFRRSPLAQEPLRLLASVSLALGKDVAQKYVPTWDSISLIKWATESLCIVSNIKRAF